jgi:hypothetical protein
MPKKFNVLQLASRSTTPDIATTTQIHYFHRRETAATQPMNENQNQQKNSKRVKLLRT